MLENATFYLVLSFIIFSYIVYKNIYPLMDVQIKVYQDKIKHVLDDLAKNHMDVIEKLSFIKKETENLPEHLRNIVQEGQEKAEKLKESYNQNMAHLMIERQSVAHKTMIKMQNKLENEFYYSITKEMQDLLIEWSKEQSSNPNFHNDSFVESYFLLENRLQK